MRKIYISLLVMFASANVLNAQLVKHFTAADTAVNSWWVANSTTASWKLTECAAAADNYYALFTIDLSKLDDGAVQGAWDWATDFKIDTAMNPNALTIIENNQSKLWFNMYINTFDGVNSADTFALKFEMFTTDKFGWPSAAVAPLTPNEWQWVSIDMTTLDFSGQTIDALEGITTFKVSIQPMKEYAKQDGAFKVGIQDLTISKGAATAPAKKPCVVASANEEIVKESLDFYPNPAVDRISFNEPTTGYITNMLGAVVVKFVDVKEVSVSHLTKGVYVVSSNNSSKKLMIQE